MKFVKENNTVNYADVNMMNKTLDRAIFSEEEYIQWVCEWKEFHADLVAAIHHFRDLKNRAKVENLEAGPIAYWQRKLALRPFAHMLYWLRADKKAQLKVLKMDEAKQTEAA